MPKLNRCPHRKKQCEMIGQRGKSFHFGFHTVIYCLIDNKKCIGGNKCPHKEKIPELVQK